MCPTLQLFYFFSIFIYFLKSKKVLYFTIFSQPHSTHVLNGQMILLKATAWGDNRFPSKMLSIKSLLGYAESPKIWNNPKRTEHSHENGIKPLWRKTNPSPCWPSSQRLKCKIKQFKASRVRYLMQWKHLWPLYMAL